MTHVVVVYATDDNDERLHRKLADWIETEIAEFLHSHSTNVEIHRYVLADDFRIRKAVKFTLPHDWNLIYQMKYGSDDIYV